MAELQYRKTQYTYNANANLVLQTNTSVKRDANLPTGEPETLASYAMTDLIGKMGSRTERRKPKKPDKKVMEEIERRRQEDMVVKGLTLARTNDDVLSAPVNPWYKPTTPQNVHVYGLLLQQLELALGGGQPRDILQHFCHEVLNIIKDEKEPVAEKQRVLVNKLVPNKVNHFDTNTFSKILSLGKQITDFRLGWNPDDLLGRDPVVPIDFTEADHLVHAAAGADSDEEESSGEPTVMPRHGGPVEEMITSGMDLQDTREFEIDPYDIDAHWLTRKMGEVFEDAQMKKKKADEVFEMLERDGRTLETELLDALGSKNFDLAQELIRNKDTIVWCIRLKLATTEDEKEKLQEEMNKTPALARILLELNTRKGTGEQILSGKMREIMKEAKRISRKDGEVQRVRTNTDLSSDALWFNGKEKDVLDFDSMIFSEKGHFKSTNNWQLREGSKFSNHKGYQEISVPAIQAPHRKKKLISIEDLPKWTHKAFYTKKAEDEMVDDKITSLNEVQSQCYESAFKSAQNLLVCAPTGAGKTNVALLTMLREIGTSRDENGKFNLNEFKIVYIAPMKSLVREIVMKFNKRLSPYGIKVAELSGDTQLNREQLNSTQVIVSTPEKWDIVTRKGMDRSYTSLVKLIIIDEIHMLHDDRGPVLEAIVARTIRYTEQTQEYIRLVGLSATLPNYKDAAQFLRVNIESGLFYFDGSYRPCPLVQRFAGITAKKPMKQIELQNKLCYQYCKEQFTRKNQVIVFVHSRKETVNTARNIIEYCRDNDTLEQLLPPASPSFDILKEESAECRNDYLKDLLTCGVGIHHAGMTRDDRSLVEDLFREEHIKILISTATLAYGVNLPAHAVIVKGTQIYSPEKGKWVEISMQDIMQMFGRAGRPGFDTTGEAYLITSHRELYYYLPLLNEQLPIESQLISKLADLLNAEIVLGTVTNLKEATAWLAYTYLFVRMLSNPEIYKLTAQDLENDPMLEQRRIDLAHTAVTLLDKSNLIKYDKKSGSFQVTELGRVCAHYYLTHTTIQTFNEHLKPTMSDIEIFRVFSLADEFKYMGVREEEEKELSILKDKVPIPIKESVREASCKVNILLQAYIARLKLQGYALLADMVYVTQSAGRLMRALFEITLKRKWAPLAVRTIKLCKMIKHRMWSIESPLRQFKGRIPNSIIRRIEKSTFSWDRFFDLSGDQIGELINFPKQGKNIHKLVHRVPRLELKGHVQTITRTVIKVELKISADFRFDEKIHGNRQDFWLLVEDVDSEKILHYEFFVLRKKFADTENRLSFTIPIYSPRPPQYFVRVISDSWLGSEYVMPISFRHLILPQKFPVPSELLDLRPLAIETLQDNAPEAMEMYKNSGIDELNSIQTQVYNVFFKGDENIFLGAPSGSGKTLCAELAIIKMIENYPNGRCVYIAPYESLAKERYEDWRARFGDSLGCTVKLLTGDTTADSRALGKPVSADSLEANPQIIISNPVNWDKISRRWRRKKVVQNVNLFIVDDLHLISGGVNGSTLEMIVSRMRYMENQTQNPMRFIALATSVANYNDLADWIGARTRYNFPLSNRPMPLETKIVGSDINSYEDRQIAFLRPCYAHIGRYSPNSPVIIFAPNRKYTRTIASDLMALASAEEDAYKFLHLEKDEFEPHVQQIKSESLKMCLRHGIGYIHEYTSEEEKKKLKTFFEAGATQIIVVERTLAWGLGLQANMVCIMGTSYYDGALHAYEDYKIADIIKMMGYAQQPSSREVCTSVVFTHAAKTDFFKKFLQDSFPVESHLEYDLADHINAEIASTKAIENATDAVDLLTWTFYHTRLSQNPNYYSLKSVSNKHLSTHLSELVEEIFDELSAAQCITVDEGEDGDKEVSHQNPGMIASYYYIKTGTVDIFSQAITSKRKLKGLLDILCNAIEFEDIPVRRDEDYILERLAKKLPKKISSPDWLSSATKAHVLLQTHFSRFRVSLEIAADRDKIVTQCISLLWAMLDLLSTEQYLNPTLIVLELCQMITQGLWNTDSPLLQLPHFTRAIAEDFKKQGVEGIFDILEMEEEDRKELLDRFTPSQLKDIARVCNLYPNVEITHELQEDKIYQGKDMTLTVKVEREDIEDDDLDEEEKANKPIPVPYAHSPLYNAPKVESWFLVVGDKPRNNLLTVKRFAMSKLLMSFDLTFTAPKRPGDYTYKLYLMSDSYVGCDFEAQFNFTVHERTGDESDDEESESDSR